MDTNPVGRYESLHFNSPMTELTADRLVAQLSAITPQHVLDVGCGWAELLLRLLAANPRTTGHGIDHDEMLIERARRNATDRGLSSRVTFSAALAHETPSDLVLNVGAEHVFGDLDQALAGLRQLVKPGGRLLLGTLFWERPPSPDLVESIGDLPALHGLVGLATTMGWRPLDLRVASPQDWDQFEFGFLADWEQLVMTAAEPADADQARRAADNHRSNYLRRRGSLGFAFLTLGLPRYS